MWDHPTRSSFNVTCSSSKADVHKQKATSTQESAYARSNVNSQVKQTGGDVGPEILLSTVPLKVGKPSRAPSVHHAV
jgi:hypothetical protein